MTFYYIEEVDRIYKKNINIEKEYQEKVLYIILLISLFSLLLYFISLT